MKNFILLLILSSFINNVSAQSKVTFYTNYGEFTAELHDILAPITAGNFISLVDSGYYDGVIFHRVVNNFVIQGGDPTGTGSGGPGYTIPDEFGYGLSNVYKTLSMANSGPNTGGSQFFINMANNVFLDNDVAPLTSAHPVFGHVIENFDNVEIIDNVPVDADDRPIEDVIMDSIRIIERYYPDNDNDGYTAEFDCDDENADI